MINYKCLIWLLLYGKLYGCCYYMNEVNILIKMLVTSICLLFIACSSVQKEKSYTNFAEDINTDTIEILELGEIIKDTTSVFVIQDIEEFNDAYIIHAVKDEFYIRIRSMKVYDTPNEPYDSIVIGNSYQMDIRSLKNENIRIWYSTNLGFGYCAPFSNNGEILCPYIAKEREYSQVFNLKGLRLLRE